MGSISGPGPKILHALGPKTKTIKQKQYCNKFDKELKKIQSVQACGCWTVKVSQSVCDWPTLISRQPWEVGVSFLLIPGKQGLRETEVLPGCFTAGTDLYGSRDLVLSCFPFLSVLNYMWHAIYYTILPIFQCKVQKCYVYLLCYKTNLQYLWLWHYPERVIIRSEHPPEPHCKPAPFPTSLHWSHSQFGHSTWDTQTHAKTNTFTCGVCLISEHDIALLLTWLPLCLIMSINMYAILCHLKYNFLCYT